MPKKHKKRKGGKLVCENGIVLGTDLGLTLDRESGTTAFSIIRLIIAAMTVMATVCMAESFIFPDYEAISYGTVFIIALFTSAAVMCLNCKQALAKVVGALYLTVITVSVLSQLKQAVNGMIYTIYEYTKVSEITIPSISAAYSDKFSVYTDIFFTALTFVTALGISLACVYRTSFVILFLFTFPTFELGAFWGLEPKTWTVVVMIISWIVILSLNISNRSSNKKGRSHTFSLYRRKKTYYMTSEDVKARFNSYASSFMAIITALCFAIGVIACADGTPRPAKFDELRKEISNGFKDFSADLSSGEAFSSINIPGIGKNVGGTNGGRLGLYDEIDFSGKTALEVTADSITKTMYLRGYVADNYANNCWTPSKTDEDVAEIFEQNGAAVLDYGYLQQKEIGESFSVSVKAVNANKSVIYAPYSANYSACKNFDENKYDGMATPKKRSKKYTLNGALLAESSWEGLLYAAEQESEYNENSSFTAFYNAYVDNSASFTYVPDELRDTLSDIVLQCQSYRFGTDTASGAAESIKQYFENKGFTYTLSPGITPDGSDFVQYFLTEQKEGYCTYYASAGVMLMRAMGYRARYVEGYIVTPEQAQDGADLIRVTDRCAHAWCEVFIENVGWLPIEFTPGYSDENPNLTSEELDTSSEDSQSDEESSYRRDESSSQSDSDSSQEDADDSSMPDESSSEEDSSASDTILSFSRADSNVDSSGDTDSTSDDSESATYGGTVGKGGGESSGEGYSVAAFYAAVSAGFVVLILLIGAVRRKINLKKIDKIFRKSGEREGMIRCYGFYLKYLELAGVKIPTNTTDTKLTKAVAAQLGEIEPSLIDAFMRISECAVAVQWGGKMPDEGDVKYAECALKEVKSRIYSRLSAWEKFSAKWVKNLY